MRVIAIFLILGYGLLFVGIPFSDSSEEIDYYNPQKILSFAEYLYSEGDYLRAVGEYQRYLFYSKKDVDSILYKIALSYRLSGEMEKSINFFQKILEEYPQGDFFLSASYQTGYTYFLMGQYEDSVSHLKETMNKVEDEKKWKFKTLGLSAKRIETLIGLNYLKQRRWNDASRLFDSLASINESAIKFKEFAEKGKHLPHKSPFLAGFLSSVVPGAGKVYSKRAFDGFYSFTVLGLTGWLTYDSFRRGGINSTKGWFFGTLSGIFYIGNIYGSVVAAQIYNRQVKAEFVETIPIEIP